MELKSLTSADSVKITHLPERNESSPTGALVTSITVSVNETWRIYNTEPQVLSDARLEKQDKIEAWIALFHSESIVTLLSK